MNAKPRYIMISSEIRNDLESPLSHMHRLEVWHLYNRAPWKDMRSQDFGPRTTRFRTPVDLYFQLERIKPDIIQGPEPFSLLMFPFLIAVLVYLSRHSNVRLVTLSLEPIPLAQKYHSALVPIFRFVLSRWFRRADIVFWFDHGSLENLRSFGAIESQLVNHLYGSWGVDMETFKPDGPRIDYKVNKPVILYLGRLSKVKGVLYLIESFRLLRTRGVEALLAIAGDGPEREDLEQRAKASGFCDDVVFHGLVKNVDVPSYMRGADVLALPSITSKLWVQQISMTAWQAMACGLPVVASDTGQMAEFTPVDAGILVPERDAAALADAIQTLLEDSDLSGRMGEAARAYASQRFDSRANVLRAEEIILERCCESGVFAW